MKLMPHGYNKGTSIGTQLSFHKGRCSVKELSIWMVLESEPGHKVFGKAKGSQELSICCQGALDWRQRCRGANTEHC